MTGDMALLIAAAGTLPPHFDETVARNVQASAEKPAGS
jgi:hypothetical protein